MSLREITLQTRVDALEETVEALAMAIRTHLPASTNMVDGALSAIENAEKHIEKTLAQAVNASRVSSRMSYDRPLDVSQLNEMLKIYAPLLSAADKDQRFFKKLKSHGLYSYAANPHELDLSQIPRSAYMGQPHVGGRPKYDSTRMTLHLQARSDIGLQVLGISGTELYQNEWVSYSTEYDGQGAPLFEREFVDAMKEILRTLGHEEAMIQPNFELNGVNGVVHGLTLTHHTWRRKGELLGEPIEGRGVILKPTLSTKELGTGMQIALWKDNPDLEIEIQLSPQFGDAFRLRVPRDSQTLSLRKYGGDDREMRPSDLSILNRMRLKLLIEFVVEIMKEKRTDLSFRDASGRIVEWEVSTIPYPEEA